MRPDIELLIEVHNKIRDFGVELERQGYTTLLIVDGLMAAGINAAVLLAGRQATADCLDEWARRVAEGWGNEQHAAAVEKSETKH
jgi:hypothetical protein